MTPKQLMRLHEAACRLRAYPRTRRELGSALRVLSTFHRRRDLARNAEALANTGIAGTPNRYRFFWPMARWLASRHPRLLTIDWSDDEFVARLKAALPSLVTVPEAEALRRADLHPRKALRRMRGRMTDAAFVIERIAALPGDDFTRETTHDALDLPYRLERSPSGPSRTRAFFGGAPFALRKGPPDRSRPDLAAALRIPPRRVRALTARDGARMIDLAREAMVTRSRDLDAFAHGDPRDVRLIDDGDGLAFGLIGVVPERRLFLPAVYGALTLRNGVPIGYVQIDVLFGNAEISYNTFETFRGGEAGFVFGRLLAAVRSIFSVRTFSIEPYQLGRGNDEGIESGAWWFYARFGFRPRDPATVRLAGRELRRRAADPEYRSGRAVLVRLAQAHTFWPGAGHDAVVTPIASIGFAIARHLARRGVNRESAMEACEARAARRLGVRAVERWSPAERSWWRRWAPMIDALPGLDRFTTGDRRSLVAIVRAKAGRRETEFVRAFDAHPRLASAILALGSGRRGVR